MCKLCSPNLSFADSEILDASFLINKSPEEIVKYFEDKGYKYSFKWHEVWQDQHNKVFTVAKAMRMDILQTIRDQVTKAVKEGITLEQFITNLEPTLKASGWWGKQYAINPNTGFPELVQLGSPERLRTIYETNLLVGYNIGNYKTLIENIDHYPYWQYNSIMDLNTRPAHAQLDGLVYRYDHPFWKTYYPPNDWGCRCHVVSLSENDLKNKKLTVSETMPPEWTLPPSEWAYNVGRKAYKPKKSKYDKDIWDAANQQ